MKYYLFIILLVLAAPALRAQVPTQAQTRQELRDRNIDEAELQRRLQAKGINLQGASPEELLSLRPQIEATIREMEAEQAEAKINAKEVAAKSSEEIQEAVEDGASVAEAISEVTAAEAAAVLPPSSIYGHQIFRNKSLKVYRTTENVTPPDTYPLKPGDEIAVSIFGASQTDFILRLDKSGFVILPNQIRMPLGGIPLGEARVLLASRLKQFYAFGNGQLSIRIQAARTISVNIFGEVESNGTFSLSSLNTGFNALVAAGGPTDRGTVRNIQLIEGDKKTILDVYDFLQSPTEGTGLFISNNSTIFVPLAEKIVSLSGGVARPMRYELKAGETLSDLLAFAGGTRQRAENNNIRVTRYVNGQLELFNVNLAENPDFALVNEDMVNVPVIENPIENFVTIQGSVLLPGPYTFEEGMTLRDLMTLGRLRPGARTDAAFLFRFNTDGTRKLLRIDPNGPTANEVLQRGDVLRILAESSFIDNSSITIAGAVRNGETTLPFPQDGAISLEEAILLAGGPSANATPEVMLIRTPLTNTEERKYERLDIRTAGTTILQPFDRVIVYTRERFSDSDRVLVGGAVRSPGTFTYDPSLQLRDLLYLAGGLRREAAKSRIEVFRLAIADDATTRTLVETITVDDNLDAPGFVLQPADEIIVRAAAEYEPIESVSLGGEVRYPGRYALLNDNEKISSLIARAGGLTPEAFAAGATLQRDGIGYVVLGLDAVDADPNHPANMVLLAGDNLFIPKKNDLVTIYVDNTLANRFGTNDLIQNGKLQVAYQGEKSARWYIKNYAGGFNEDTARKRWTTVEYASGQIDETNNFLFLKDYPEVLPGSSIRIESAPPKRVKERRESRFDWIGLTSVIVGGATTIVSFVLLSRR